MSELLEIEKQNIIYRLFLAEKNEEVSERFLSVLFSYHQAVIISLTDKETLKLNSFIRLFLEIFIQEKFVIPEHDIDIYIRMNPVISNMVACSELKTTDFFLPVLIGKGTNTSKNNLVKFLSLCSPRNYFPINYKLLFEIDFELASMWYWSYFRTMSLITENNYLNLQNHIGKIKDLDKKLTIYFKDELKVTKSNKKNEFIIPYLDQDALFSSSNIDPEKDRAVKHKINSLIKEKISYVKIKNSPSKKKIAVISAYMFPGHSVYRGTYEFIKELANDYELTLVSLGKFKLNQKDSIFKKEIHLEFFQNYIHISALNNNEFIMALYPDTGLSPESAFLANIRIASIQVTIHGHSISNFGSEIDYFISGTESEVISDAEKNYSEQLVLIEGIGLHRSYPNYKVLNIKKSVDKFIIVCSWSYQKVNYPHLLNLKKILEGSNKKITFRFFINSGRGLTFVINKREITEILGENNVEIFSGKPYGEYMQLIEESNMAIDSFHFGGYNTIIDSLYLDKPVITPEGNKAYNKFSSALLRRLDLDELIASNSEEYIYKTLNLINNQEYFTNIKEKIKSLNLKQRLFETSENISFKKAIDYLIENHEQIKLKNSKEPIFIK